MDHTKLIVEAQYVDWPHNYIQGYLIVYPDNSAAILPPGEWAPYSVKLETVRDIKK